MEDLLELGRCCGIEHVFDGLWYMGELAIDGLIVVFVIDMLRDSVHKFNELGVGQILVLIRARLLLVDNVRLGEGVELLQTIMRNRQLSFVDNNIFDALQGEAMLCLLIFQEQMNLILVQGQQLLYLVILGKLSPHCIHL